MAQIREIFYIFIRILIIYFNYKENCFIKILVKMLFQVFVEKLTNFLFIIKDCNLYLLFLKLHLGFKNTNKIKISNKTNQIQTKAKDRKKEKENKENNKQKK